MLKCPGMFLVGVVLIPACAPQAAATVAGPAAPSTMRAPNAAVATVATAKHLPTDTPLPIPSLPSPLAGNPQSGVHLPQQARWQIQYSGDLQTDLAVDVFNLDLFDTPAETIATLHQRRVFVMCYFSAGSYEAWRPDAPLFPQAALGNELEGWPGEKWLDIRRIDLLAPIMEARLDLARYKSCDGVDPDNVNGYTNESGFPLTADDQKRYNLFLAQAAHRRGLLIGLKNDLEQIAELVSHFDWVLNESCFFYDECEALLPFGQAGKAVFVIEYQRKPSEFCPLALAMNFNALHKKKELDAYRVDCREW